MSEKLLLLSAAKPLALLPTTRSKKRGKPSHELLRALALGVGMIVVLVGAASALSSLAHVAFGSVSNDIAFGPAVASAPGLDALFSGSAPATTTPITPARLGVPSIGVNAAVEAVGKNADGAMATPKQFMDVTWYSLGVKPGDQGRAVFAGHVNNALTKAGVFEHLGDVKIGDTILVADAQGTTLTYVVREVEAYSADQAPVADIFATSGPSELVLITCDGEWVQSERSYSKRLVVYARLADGQ